MKASPHIGKPQHYMRVLASVNSRWLPVLAIAAVLFAQSLVAVVAAQVGPFELWPATLLLLVPSLAWLVPPRPVASLAATGVTTAFIVIAHMVGGAGYVAAFWIGLPVAALVAWRVARRENRESPRNG